MAFSVIAAVAIAARIGKEVCMRQASEERHTELASRKFRLNFQRRFCQQKGKLASFGITKVISWRTASSSEDGIFLLLLFDIDL